MNERQRIKNYGIIVHVRSLGLVLVDYLWMMSHFGVQPLGRARAWPTEYLPVALVMIPWAIVLCMSSQATSSSAYIYLAWNRP